MTVVTGHDIVRDLVPLLPGPQPSPLRGGGGGGSSIKMPGFVYWGSENVPILKDVLGKNYIAILKGSSAYVVPIL